MKIQFNIRVTALILISLAFCLTANAQKSNEKGITFKIPENVMPIEWKDFKGMLMLSPKKPSGIFISYPNDGETLESLTIRAGKSIAQMFVHDEKKAENIEWQIKSIPAHRGDKGDSATSKIYEGESATLQITFYEREWNNLKIIYGYFAQKSKTSKNKDDSADFLDDKGQGSDTFDKFWKTFPAK
ncbi:MAG TPA: hypothetical protein VGC76_19115 [Pyrinomonadaceae bacterium]|jgi:hypothetical protein